MSVAKLAREHGVNTNLLFRWRRQYRQGLFGAVDASSPKLPTTCAATSVAAGADGLLTLLPVETTPMASATVPAAIEVLFACATVRIHGHRHDDAALGARRLGTTLVIGLPLGTRVWIAAGVTDMRKGMDGLAALVQTALAREIRSRAMCSCSAASAAIW